MMFISNRYHAELLLNTGSRISIRPIRPEDASLESDFVSRLTEESFYFRFFDSRHDLALEIIKSFCNIDYQTQIALVAELSIDESNEEKLRMFVAVGQIIETTNNRGEFAIVVADEFQGLGIGSKLTELLLLFARDRKLRSLFAVILPENNAMMNMAGKLGFKIRSSERGLVIAELPLDETSRENLT